MSETINITYAALDDLKADAPLPSPPQEADATAPDDDGADAADAEASAGTVVAFNDSRDRKSVVNH